MTIHPENIHFAEKTPPMHTEAGLSVRVFSQSESIDEIEYNVINNY